LIIGLSGKIAAGKTTEAVYLNENYQFEILKTSDLLDSVLEAKKMKSSRKNQQALGDRLISVVGPGGFVAMMLYSTSETNRVIDAIRYSEAITYLKDKYGDEFKHIHIEASDSIRYARRGSKKIRNVNRFKQIDRASTELDNDRLRRLADQVIKNESTLDALYSKLEDFMLTVHAE
jgi:dephospho-CoA kinase